jgi:hypothetical protein
MGTRLFLALMANGNSKAVVDGRGRPTSPFGIALCPVAPAQGITGVISPGNVASNTAHVQNIC